jgi:steroid Delta-isomerase
MELKDLPIASMSAVNAHDREGWLALFTDDAFVQDPVGPSAWDPEGKGLQGKEAIAGFYDMFAQFQQSLDYDIHHLATGNNEVAVFVTLHSTLKDGTTNSIKAINIYKAAEDGRIQSLRSFQHV